VAGEYFASGLVSAGVDCAVAEERGCGRVARKGLIRSAVSLALAAHTEEIKTGAFLAGRLAAGVRLAADCVQCAVTACATGRVRPLTDLFKALDKIESSDPS